MTNRSQRLRLSDIRGVYELVNRVLEAGNEPDTWRAVALQGLCERTGATVGLTVDLAGLLPGQTPHPISPLDVGWTDESKRKTYYEYISSGQMHDDPGTIALLTMHRRIRFLTKTRRQMIDDATWYAAWSVDVARRSGDVDDFVCSTVVLRPGALHGFVVYHPWGAPHFGQRECRIARLLHVQLLRRMRPPAPAGAEPRLSPRLKQTLELLLAGDGVKQIAQSLDLSPHTIGDYVKALYQKFEVRTRGELLSRHHNQRQTLYLKLPPGLLEDEPVVRAMTTA